MSLRDACRSFDFCPGGDVVRSPAFKATSGAARPVGRILDNFGGIGMAACIAVCTAHLDKVTRFKANPAYGEAAGDLFCLD